jgi:3-oxoacyl-[acyl-carrier-protein] synthase II
MSEAVQPSSSDPMPGSTARGAPMNILGVGAVTGYGWGTKHLWDGFLLGESAVKLTTGLEGFVDGGQAYLSLIADEGDRRDGPSRFMQAARAAAREAISDAMERGWKPGPVVGLVHSIEAGDIETWSKFYRSGESRVRPKTWVNMLPSTVLSQLMKENDFHGPTMSVSAMCATANAAMITAKSWLDTGVASDVILLATDLCGVPQVLRGFSDLGAAILSMPAFEACRPFQGPVEELPRFLCVHPRWGDDHGRVQSGRGGPRSPRAVPLLPPGHAQRRRRLRGRGLPQRPRTRYGPG